jgi:signal transduction histidine kinase/ActR/RegA family two-component response regulator
MTYWTSVLGDTLMASRLNRVLKSLLVSVFILMDVVSLGNATSDLLSAEERSWLSEHGSQLVLAVETGYAPFVFLDESGKPAGLAHEYVELLQSKLGVRFKYREFSSLKEIFNEVKTGGVQVVNAVTATPARAEFLRFTKPFIVVPNVIIVRKERSGTIGENELAKLRVSLVDKYAVTDFVLGKKLGLEPDIVPDDLTAILHVSFGQSDAAIVDLATASFLISTKGISNLRGAGEIGFDIRLALASPKEEPLLAAILQKGLGAISGAERKSIQAHWIGMGERSLLFDWRLWASAGTGLLLILGAILAILIWNRTLRTQVALRTADLARELAQRKLVEEALRQAKTEAEAATEVKSRFLAAMSHELRTPLNPIIGFADLLAQATNLTEEQREWLNIVRQRGEDLLFLIGDILDLSKIEADRVVLNPLQVSLRRLVAEMVTSVQPAAARKNLRLDFSVDPNLPDELILDGPRLRQILLNLLNNALKFTAKGRVALHVGRCETGRVLRVVPGSEIALQFCVSDTGIGVSAEEQSTIFEPFAQAAYLTAREHTGAGLGLAIALKLVTLMGGKIWVESVQNQGSSFYFTVIAGVSPIEKTAEEELTRSEWNLYPPSKILLIDNDPASLCLERNLLEQRGDWVRTVADGTVALEILESESFDVVLVDLQTPHLSGIDIARAVRAHDKRLGHYTAIIAVTAHALKEFREQCFSAGMDGFVTKPVARKVLLEAIAAALKSATNGGS